MMKRAKVIVTLFTPFDREGRIDHGALRDSAAFYRQAGVDGLFANCQTSETLRLGEAERIKVVETLAGADCGIPLYSGINWGPTLGDQRAFLRRIHQAGADVPVVWLSTLPRPDRLAEQAIELAGEAECDLGIYECPDPEHRLFDDEELQEVARSGRFVFFKDTCRDNAVFARRMERIRGTSLHAYQANWKCLPDSLEEGAEGFSGWLAAARPDAVLRYCDPSTGADSKKLLHKRLFELQEAMREADYPASGKFVVSLQGLRLEPNRRTADGSAMEMNPRHARILRRANERVDEAIEDGARTMARV